LKKTRKTGIGASKSIKTEARKALHRFRRLRSALIVVGADLDFEMQVRG
jgi:hypothetical protein